MKIFLGYTLTYLYLILILAIISFIEKKKLISSLTSRKLIHIFVGLSWFIMIYFFNTSYHLIIPPATFIILNYYTSKKGLMKSMSQNGSYSTVYYAISFAFLAGITVINSKFLPYYGLGVLAMTLGDGLAPFIGKIFPKKIGHSSKTYGGVLTVFLSTVLIATLINLTFNIPLNIFKILIIAITSSILEFFGGKFDNLTLPIGVSLLAYILQEVL